MRCYDCEMKHNRTMEASATCSVCSAGLCGEHAIEGYAEEKAQWSLGNPAVVRLNGRRIFCETCAPDYLELTPTTRSAASLAG